jgi:hypothetical protein
LAYARARRSRAESWGNTEANIRSNLGSGADGTGVRIVKSSICRENAPCTVQRILHGACEPRVLRNFAGRAPEPPPLGS